MLVTFIAFEKSEKECNMLEIILVQGFRPLKIKITHFRYRFCLKLIYLYQRKVVLPPFIPEVYEVNK